MPGGSGLLRAYGYAAATRGNHASAILASNLSLSGLGGCFRWRGRRQPMGDPMGYHPDVTTLDGATYRLRDRRARANAGSGQRTEC